MFGISTADLNGDNKADLVVVATSPGWVYVALGNGDGTFQSPLTYSVSDTAGSPRIADFNGDGKLDVAAVTPNGSSGFVSVLRGNGDGTLQTPRLFPTQNTPYKLVVTDFNKDGKPDLITTNNGIGRINVLLNSPSARGADFNATATLPASNVKVASFIDYDTTKTAASFTASINWGAGTAAGAGTVAANGSGGFDVTGSHTYALPGLYNVTVQLADTAGNFASATARATVAKKDQTVTFDTLSNRTFGNPDFTVSATASSGLAVSFAADGQCTVSGTTVHITGAGSCTVTASQSGDAIYNAAPGVPQTFQIAKASTTTAVSTSLNPAAVGQSVTFTAAVTSSAGTPTGTVQFKVDGANAGAAVSLSGGGATFTTSALTAGAHVVTADYNGDTNFNISSGTLSGGQTVGSVFEFAQAAYNVAEGGTLTVTVKRTGDTSQAASVDYATDDGIVPSVAVPCSSTTGLALDRCDYTKALGTLHFAAGETEKTVTILIGQDSYAEGAETFQLKLSNPLGNAAVGPKGTATVTIADDSPETTGNPIDDTDNFVRQHYLDFLNREPDASGFQFWRDGIEVCGADAGCREVKRIDTSAAFFLSIEFQETGYLVERVYKTAYGDATSPNVPGTVPIVRFNEFMPDTQRIGDGVVVGAGTWQQRLEANKQAYALEFVQRPRFLAAFPASMTAAEFVSKLDENAGGVLSADEKTQLVSSLGSTPADASKRAAALRQVAEHASLRQRELNRAFVLMQFYGYLRRDPDAAPDADFRGWKFWLSKLEEFGGDYRRAEMVKAFLSSIEYRQRFGR